MLLFWLSWSLCRMTIRTTLHSQAMAWGTLSLYFHWETNSPAVYHHWVGLDLQPAKLPSEILAIHFIGDIDISVLPKKQADQALYKAIDMAHTQAGPSALVKDLINKFHSWEHPEPVITGISLRESKENYCPQSRSSTPLCMNISILSIQIKYGK